MSYPVSTYIVYLVVSVSLTVWVARTLFKNGRVFLVDAFHGNETLADSVNHLLVVGFYLINVGFVTMALKYGDKPGDMVQAIELTSTKVGLVLIVLGVMHFFNLYLFSRTRRRTPPKATRPAHTPVPPPAPLVPPRDRDSRAWAELARQRKSKVQAEPGS